MDPVKIDPRVANVIVVTCLWGIAFVSGFLLGVVRTQRLYISPGKEEV